MNSYDLSKFTLDELFEMMHKAAKRGDGEFLAACREELNNCPGIELGVWAEMKNKRGYAKSLRKLQAELNYWNMQLRLETRWVRETKAKVREIEKKIEALECEVTDIVIRLSKKCGHLPAEFDYICIVCGELVPKGE